MNQICFAFFLTSLLSAFPYLHFASVFLLVVLHTVRHMPVQYSRINLLPTVSWLLPVFSFFLVVVFGKLTVQTVTAMSRRGPSVGHCVQWTTSSAAVACTRKQVGMSVCGQEQSHAITPFRLMQPSLIDRSESAPIANSIFLPFCALLNVHWSCHSATTILATMLNANESKKEKEC